MQRTRSKPLTIDIANIRLSLFGHILRQPRTPAYRIMEHYFKSDKPFKPNNVPAYPLHVPEKSKTTIVHQLHTDLNKVAKNFVNYIDLLYIQTIAQDRAKWKNLVTRIISADERHINRSNEIKKTGKRTLTETTTTTIATENQSRNKKKQKMSNDNQQRASVIGRKKKKMRKPKTKKKIQGRKKSKDEDQDMDIDDGNKEDEEALATGRESDVCERMVMDEGLPGI
jgi:hypothetical protein